MTHPKDLERRLARHLAVEAPPRAPDWVLANALTVIDSTAQARRSPLLHRPARLPAIAGIAATAVLIVAVGAIGLLAVAPRAGPGSGGPLATPSPTASASPSPSQRPLGAPARVLEAGTYTLEDFPVSLTFVLPDGWAECSAGSAERVVCGPPSPSEPARPSVSFVLVENVVAQPCSGEPRDPAVGPSVDDLVMAITSLRGFQATRPVPVTLDGFAGRHLELTAPAAPACDLETWATAERVNGVGPGERNVLLIVDVDGVRLLVAGAYFPGVTSLESIAAVDEILASVRLRGAIAPPTLAAPS